MMLHEVVDVFLAVEASVHDKLELVEFEEINILNEILYSLNIRDVACKLSVVYRKH
jgi:hypothetical protein